MPIIFGAVDRSDSATSFFGLVEPSGVVVPGMKCRDGRSGKELSFRAMSSTMCHAVVTKTSLSDKHS